MILNLVSIKIQNFFTWRRSERGKNRTQRRSERGIIARGGAANTEWLHAAAQSRVPGTALIFALWHENTLRLYRKKMWCCKSRFSSSPVMNHCFPVRHCTGLAKCSLSALFLFFQIRISPVFFFKNPVVFFTWRRIQSVSFYFPDFINLINVIIIFRGHHYFKIIFVRFSNPDCRFECGLFQGRTFFHNSTIIIESSLKR